MRKNPQNLIHAMNLYTLCIYILFYRGKISTRNRGYICVATRVSNFVVRRNFVIVSRLLRQGFLSIYLKISAGLCGRAGGYGCGCNPGVSSSYVRYLRSVTGHLLNRQREREQEEHRGRRRKEARETGAKRRG